jgi:hypothetical protein
LRTWRPFRWYYRNGWNRRYWPAWIPWVTATPSAMGGNKPPSGLFLLRNRKKFFAYRHFETNHPDGIPLSTTWLIVPCVLQNSMTTMTWPAIFVLVRSQSRIIFFAVKLLFA